MIISSCLLLYSSNATACLMRPCLFYAFSVVSRSTINVLHASRLLKNARVRQVALDNKGFPRSLPQPARGRLAIVRGDELRLGLAAGLAALTNEIGTSDPN